jgi:hypothetical protein
VSSRLKMWHGLAEDDVSSWRKMGIDSRNIMCLLGEKCGMDSRTIMCLLGNPIDNRQYNRQYNRQHNKQIHSMFNQMNLEINYFNMYAELNACMRN